MAQFSVKIMRLTGSVLGENQQHAYPASIQRPPPMPGINAVPRAAPYRMEQRFLLREAIRLASVAPICAMLIFANRPAPKGA